MRFASIMKTQAFAAVCLPDTASCCAHGCSTRHGSASKIVLYSGRHTRARARTHTHTHTLTHNAAQNTRHTHATQFWVFVYLHGWRMAVGHANIWADWVPAANTGSSFCCASRLCAYTIAWQGLVGDCDWLTVWQSGMFGDARWVYHILRHVSRDANH